MYCAICGKSVEEIVEGLSEQLCNACDDRIGAAMKPLVALLDDPDVQAAIEADDQK